MIKIFTFLLSFSCFLYGSFIGGIKEVPLDSSADVVIFEGKIAPKVKKDNGIFAILPIAIDAKTGVQSYFINGEKIDFLIEDKKYREQRITLKDNKKVDLSPEDIARFEKEKIEIQSYINSYTKTDILIFPMQTPTIGKRSSEYGVKRFFNDKPRSPHSGLDIAAPMGSEVKSTLDGVVVGIGDYFFNGKSIFIDHGLGVVSMYCHLDEILVRPNQQVNKGELIGKVGRSGRSSGPHLHLGIYILGKSIDPELFLNTQK